MGILAQWARGLGLGSEGSQSRALCSPMGWLWERFGNANPVVDRGASTRVERRRSRDSGQMSRPTSGRRAKASSPNGLSWDISPASRASGYEEGSDRGASPVRLKLRRTCSFTGRAALGSCRQPPFRPTVAGFRPRPRSAHVLSGLTPRRGLPLRTPHFRPRSGLDSLALAPSRWVRFIPAFGTDAENPMVRCHQRLAKPL